MTITESEQRSLADWIVPYWGSPEYEALTETMRQREHTTPPSEIAMLYSLIRRIKPERALEIGTYFAQTSLAMAEAVSANGVGHLDTIDPYGGDRIPEIMSKWPEAERKVTTFAPIYWMNYFSDLEHKHEMLGLAFVDGNHKFDYALYDLLCSADRLLPTGAIVVDNLEQEGPYLATKMFFRLNSGWKVFFHGQIQSASEAQEGLTREMIDRGSSWAVLLPPPAFCVSGRGYQQFAPTRRHPIILGVQLNVVDLPRPIEVTLRCIHLARAYDSHITGEPHISDVRRVSKEVSPGQRIADFRFDPPLDLHVTREDANFDYFLEIALPQVDDYLLLDPDHPFEIIYG